MVGFMDDDGVVPSFLPCIRLFANGRHVCFLIRVEPFSQSAKMFGTEL